MHDYPHRKSLRGVSAKHTSERRSVQQIMSDKQDNALEDGAVEEIAHTKPVSRAVRLYRSPLFNVILVGLISFTQPGIWNALNSMSTEKDIETSRRLIS